MPLLCSRIQAGSVAAVLLGGLLPATAQADEPRQAVWVFLHDKGPATAEHRLATALAAREAELPERTLERRRKNRGDRGVDHRDLPVAPAYRADIEATGVRIRVESRWLNALSVDATPSQRRALERLPEVARVEPVRRHRHRPEPRLSSDSHVVFGTDEFGASSAQLDLVGAIPLHRFCGLTGAGVVVGVQDTGFELDHQAFSGVVVLAAHDFINDDGVVANEPGDPGGQSNHGTWVMGTLAGSDPGTFMGVAPGIEVILTKTERVDAEVQAEEDYYVAGLEWIESQGADVFTASLGYLDWYSPEDLDGQTAASTIAVDVAFDNGLLVFVSMGNAGPGPSTLLVPADAEGALGVGATTLAGDVAGFSSRGPTADGRTKPDISAPGVEVASVQLGTTDQYETWNGTSAAAPMAAGLAALILEARPELTAQQLADILRDTASQAATPDDDLGWGIVDGRLASGDACGCNDTDGDGFIGVLCGGDDCDDGRAEVHPGIDEMCDGVDTNCDGTMFGDEVDQDGDGVMRCEGDCDDEEPMVTPGRVEICGDGLDNDCVGGDEPCPESTGAVESGDPVTTTDADDTAGDSDGPALPGGTGAAASSSSAGGSDSGAAADGEDGGCSCSSSGRRSLPSSTLLLLALGAWRRRRATHA